MRWFCIKKGAQKVVKRFEIFWIFYSKHFFLKGREHYRSWDYSENFGIYSQLDRTSKTWFFSFPNLYFSRIKRDKILISQLSPPKISYFTNQNGPKGGLHESEIWQLSNAKMGSFVWFSCLRPELWPLNLSFLQLAKNIRLLQQYIYMYLKVLVLLFQKMVLVIMGSLRVWKLMSFDKFLGQSFFIFIPQYLVNCYQDPYKTYYFLKEPDEVF